MSSIKDNPYTIIRRPRVTEKGALLSAKQQCVVFEVHPKANRAEIKRAVEKIFDVKVKKVHTVNCLGKVRAVAGKYGFQKDWKKAYVSLAPGSSIDIIEGL